MNGMLERWNTGILGIRVYRIILKLCVLKVIPIFQHSIIPCRRYMPGVQKKRYAIDVLLEFRDVNYVF